jgi:sulfate transporter 4
MLAGALYTAVGVFQLGWLTNFLSHSVIAGFMTGASVIIGLSQVKYILGITIPRHDPVHEQLEVIFTNLGEFE